MTAPGPDHHPPETAARTWTRWPMGLSVSGALLLTVCLFAPRLRDFFLSDDFGLLWACWRPEGLFANNGWISGDSIPVASFFRFMPCSSLSGWVIYACAGLNPLGWHLANLVIHLLNSFMVGILATRVVRSNWVGIAAGTLFALHYIHVEPVIWISGRSVLLVSCFILASIVAETRARSRLWGAGRWIGLLFAILAFLSKEDSIALPLLLAILPLAPLAVDELHPRQPRWIRDELTDLKSRIVQVWPYWALAFIYLMTRLGAIAAATQEQAYRLELGFNVIKNTLFVCVANLFPLDFRTALASWNNWYKVGEQSAVLKFLLSHPGFIVGVIAGAAFWFAVLLWGNRGARRLAVFMVLAATPVLFFRGTGERLLYLSSAGSVSAIAALLAGWHGAFRETLGRAGRFVAPAAMIVLVVLHSVWLRDKQINWESAAVLSQTIVDAADTLGRSLPPGAVIQLGGLPDNVGGAWVFRSSIESAFRIYSGRPDITVVRGSSALADTLGGPPQRYHWDGVKFVPSE